jgi:hypothetical protein
VKSNIGRPEDSYCKCEGPFEVGEIAVESEHLGGGVFYQPQTNSAKFIELDCVMSLGTRILEMAGGS